MMKKKVQNEFPPGWDEERVKRVIAHCEGQTDEEAAAEDEAGLRGLSVRLGGNVSVRNVQNVQRVGAMDSVNTTELRESLANVLNRVAYGKDRLRITRRGKQLAAVVPIEDLEYLERIENEIEIREVKKALADVKKNGTIPWEEVKKEFGL